MRNRSSSLLQTAGAVLSFTLFGATCGDVAPLTREQARDQATTAVCDTYAMCGQIGASADGGAAPTYATRDSCETQWRGQFEQMWPPADCDGKISQTKFDLCQASIRAITCGNLGDVVLALSSCAKTNVCTGP